MKYSESGIELKLFYTPDDVEGDYYQKLGEPGKPPYTKGIYRDMYRGKPWTMRQYSGFASADKTNSRFKLLLKQGQTGLSIAFDLPTQLGLDPDDPRAYYEVGRVGVPIPHWKEMDRVMMGKQSDDGDRIFKCNSYGDTLHVCCCRRKQRFPAFYITRYSSKRYIEGIYSKKQLHLPPKAIDEICS